MLLFATGIGKTEVNELDFSFSFTIFITSATVLAIRFSWVKRLLKNQLKQKQAACQPHSIPHYEAQCTQPPREAHNTLHQKVQSIHSEACKHSRFAPTLRAHIRTNIVQTLQATQSSQQEPNPGGLSP